MRDRTVVPVSGEVAAKWWRPRHGLPSAPHPSPIAPLAGLADGEPTIRHRSRAVRPAVVSATATHRGLVRTHNEDAVLDAAPIGLWAVADGVGGADAGERASMTVVESLAALPASKRAADLLAATKTALEDANRRLLAESQRVASARGIASTVVCLLIAEQRFFCLWAGDSRLYRWRERQLRQINRDHTEAQSLVDRGVITAAQAKNHPGAHLITHAVGIDPALRFDCVEDGVRGGDRFVLCSDGLTKVVSDAEIALVVELLEPAQAADRLIRMVLDRGAPDNVSVAVVAIPGADPPKAA